jgi:starvation-inducible DNA-binding protein
MNTQVGISEINRGSVALAFSKILADENILYIKTKNAHWNIEGSDFYEKHMFFETQIKLLDEIIDSTAERIRTLGVYAPASLKLFLELTHLTEMSREENNSNGFIRALLIDHEAIIIKLGSAARSLAIDSKDPVSTDFISRLMGIHEKMAWFLRSHLKE